MLRTLCMVGIVCAAGCRTYAYETFKRDPPERSVLAQRAALEEPAVLRQRFSTAPREEPIIVGGGGAIAGAPPVANVVPSAGPAEPEKLVVEVWMKIQTSDVAATTAAVRARVEADGGRVVSENTIGAGRSASSSALELRVLPAKHGALMEWLGGLGAVESRRILASDVGRTLVDQELALKNLTITMGRLQALAGRDVPIKELLEIEREMTRVRGEIEKLEGDQRWLVDRVAYATISLTLVREGGPEPFAPQAFLRPGPRLSTLVMLDPEGGPRSRLGGGVLVHLYRRLTFDLDVFPRQMDAGRAVVATVGTAVYSTFFGNGRRRFGNPYLGARIGYGYLADLHSIVLAGELGLELYRDRYFLVDAAVRAVAFFHDRSAEPAMQAALGVAIPF